jgi:hypothetical protein
MKPEQIRAKAPTFQLESDELHFQKLQHEDGKLVLEGLHAKLLKLSIVEDEIAQLDDSEVEL